MSSNWNQRVQSMLKRGKSFGSIKSFPPLTTPLVQNILSNYERSNLLMRSHLQLAGALFKSLWPSDSTKNVRPHLWSQPPPPRDQGHPLPQKPQLTTITGFLFFHQTETVLAFSGADCSNDQGFATIKISAISTNSQWRFRSVVLDGVLGPQRLVQHICRCPWSSQQAPCLHLGH